MPEIEGTDAGITASETEETAAVSTATDETGSDDTVTPEEIREVLKGSGRDVSSIVSKPTEIAKADTTETKEEKPVDKVEEPKKPTEIAKATATDEPKFTLEVEDAEGNKHEISKIEDLPEDFQPKNNRQGLQILHDLQKLENDKATYEQDKQSESQKAEQAERVTKIQEGWQTEFKELGITAKADQDKVFEYLRTENAKRQEQGRPMIASIEDAKNGMDALASREAAKETEKAEKDEARRKGGLIGGGSAASSGGAPPQYRGGATNAVQAAKSMGLL